MPRFFSCALLVLACGACQLMAPDPVLLQAAPNATSVSLASGSLHYRGSVEPLPLNEYCSLQFFAEGTTLKALEFDADMPAHKHGMITKPEVVQNAEGSWSVHGMIFHMPGDWVMNVRAQTEDGWQVVDFPVTIGPR